MGSFRSHKLLNSADVPCRQLRLSFGFSKLSLCLWKGNHQSFQLTAKTHLMDTYQNSHKEGNNGAAQSLRHSKINKYVLRIQTVSCIVHHNQLVIREVWKDNSGSFFINVFIVSLWLRLRDSGKQQRGQGRADRVFLQVEFHIELIK